MRHISANSLEDASRGLYRNHGVVLGPLHPGCIEMRDGLPAEGCEFDGRSMAVLSCACKGMSIMSTARSPHEDYNFTKVYSFICYYALRTHLVHVGSLQRTCVRNVTACVNISQNSCLRLR